MFAQTPSTPAASAPVTLVPIGGGNNARSLTNNFYSGMSIFAVHLGPNIYVPSNGAVSTVQYQYKLRYDVASVAYAPLIAQGGHYYSGGFDGGGLVGTLFSINRTLSANAFSLILPGGQLDPHQHPDFSCTAPEMRFGYYTGNSNSNPPPMTPIHITSTLQAWQVDLVTTPCTAGPNPCCPPVTTASVKGQLKLAQPGTVGTNYSFTYVPSAPYTGQMQTYIDYLHQMNLAINTITLTWAVTDQGTGTTPTIPNGPTVTSALTKWVCTVSGCPPTPPVTQFGAGLLQPNRWYRVTVTPSLNNGIQFWPAHDCPPAVFEYNMREIP